MVLDINEIIHKTSFRTQDKDYLTVTKKKKKVSG